MGQHNVHFWMSVIVWTIKLFIFLRVGKIAWLYILVFAPANLCSEEPEFHTIEVEGKITELYFYGPVQWLSAPGERLQVFPHLESLHLEHGKYGIDEMRYVATVRSVESISTGPIFPDEVIEFQPGALNELGAMSWLKSLEVHSMAIPEDEWKFLSKLSMLQGFSVEGIDESGLKHLQSNDSLTYLCLYGDSAKTLPSTVFTLSQLSSLSTSGRESLLPISDDSLEMLSRLSKLVSLRLQGVSAKGIEIISRLVNLESLSLSVVDQHADTTFLRNLRHLRHLDLSVMSLDPMALSFLPDLTELSSLVLRCREPNAETIANIPFESMTNLVTVQVSCSFELDKKVLAKIAKLPKINYLSVGGVIKDLAAIRSE